jgi:hypothetical protein
LDNPRDSDEVVRAKSRRVLSYLVGLDANSVSLSFPFFTSGPRASSVFGDDATPSPLRIGILLDEAHSAGFRTTVRPLMDEQALLAVSRKSWRGNLKPASRDKWFASYQEFLAPYLRVAQDRKAATFVVGTELNSLENDARWHRLIAEARRGFKGEIAYAANWDSYLSGDVDLPVDQVGIDAYFPVQVSDEASVTRLANGWQRWLDQKSERAMPTALIYEVGIPAENGAYRHPWVWGMAGEPLNLAIQERWYAAACQVARKREMRGIYWWKLDFHTDPATADAKHDIHDSFVGRPGERAIQACFSAWGSAT